MKVKILSWKEIKCKTTKAYIGIRKYDNNSYNFNKRGMKQLCGTVVEIEQFGVYDNKLEWTIEEWMCDPSYTESTTLNFKEWLAKEGVDTKLFWYTCKKKNQGFPHTVSRVSRKVVSDIPERWLSLAFHWKDSYWVPQSTWEGLHTKWVTEVQEHTGPIAHGFTDKIIDKW